MEKLSEKKKLYNEKDFKIVGFTVDKGSKRKVAIRVNETGEEFLFSTAILAKENRDDISVKNPYYGKEVTTVKKINSLDFNTQEDIERILSKTWKLGRQSLDCKDEGHSYLYLKSCISNSNECYIAKVDGKVVGILLYQSDNKENKIKMVKKSVADCVVNDFNNHEKLFTEVYDAIDNVNGNEIHLFIVHPNYRNKGIGKKLINELEPNTEYKLWTTKNECNYEWYTRNGFKKDDKEIYIADKDDTAYIFTK